MTPWDYAFIPPAVIVFYVNKPDEPLFVAGPLVVREVTRKKKNPILKFKISIFETLEI